MRPLDVDLDLWDPWPPSEVVRRLRAVTALWYFVGGWALDVFLGRQTREHEDIEIGVPPDRFPELREALPELELAVVGDGRAWPLSDASLAAHRQTWVRERGGPWRLDIIRERWDAGEWLYRRDERIRLAATQAILRSEDGLPFLRPEAVLLSKSSAVRPKDQLDFDVVVPELEHESRRWLSDALRVAHPGHTWLEQLGSR